MKVDVIIIGAGLAGAASAAALAKTGHEVALIDARADYPPEFRAEKFGPMQMAHLERMGLAEAAMARVTRHTSVQIARYGHIVAENKTVEYSFRYADLVNGVRAAIPRAGPPHPRPGRRHRDRPRTAKRHHDGRDAGRGPSAGRRDRVRGRDPHQDRDGAHGAQPRPFAGLRLLARGAARRLPVRVPLHLWQRPQGPHLLYRHLPYRRRDAGQPVRLPHARRPLDAAVPVGSGRDASRNHAGAVAPVRRPHGEGRDRGPSDRPHDGDGTIGGTASSSSGMRSGPAAPSSAWEWSRSSPTSTGCATTTSRAGSGRPVSGADKIGAFYDDEIKRECDEKGHAMSLYARSIATDPGLVWRARRIRNAAVRRGLYAVRHAGRELLAQARSQTAQKS